MISRIRGLLDVRLAGIALAVEDLEKSIAWWEEVLEFELVSRSRVEAVGADAAIVRGAGIYIELLERLTVVAAYRDRYGVTGPDPLGAIPDADAQRVDYERARAALVALRDAHDASPDAAAPSRRGPVRDAH